MSAIVEEGSDIDTAHANRGLHGNAARSDVRPFRFGAASAPEKCTYAILNWRTSPRTRSLALRHDVPALNRAEIVHRPRHRAAPSQRVAERKGARSLVARISLGETLTFLVVAPEEFG